MDYTWLTKVGSLLEKIRTPLALGGLTVLVLFFLYKQILDLAIFPKLDEYQAFQIINLLLRNVFWLAIISVILGGISYILQFFLRQSPDPSPSAKVAPPKNKHSG
jgi:type III secretory pathway component EscU